MRRSTKPFTVEVKKRGGRRRDSSDAGFERAGVPSPAFNDMVGRDIRFRDAESLFRAIPPAEPGFAEPETPSLVATESAPPATDADAGHRRILPDLIAEAALSEATIAVPEPRRRGRPPKDRSGDPPLPARAPIFPEPDFEEVAPLAERNEIAPPPAVLYLAASARRRARRATDNLPRGERWKRRLPKVCW